MVRLRADVYARIEELKGGKSFTAFISELLDGKRPTPPTAPTSIEDKLIAPLTPPLQTTTSFDPEPEPESLDLPYDCCKELIITDGAKRCQHWHRRGYDYIHSITRRLSSEYNPDGEFDPEYCEYR